RDLGEAHARADDEALDAVLHFEPDAAQLFEPRDRDDVLGIEEALLHVGQDVRATGDDARFVAKLVEERARFGGRLRAVVVEDRERQHVSSRWGRCAPPTPRAAAGRFRSTASRARNAARTRAGVNGSRSMRTPTAS